MSYVLAWASIARVGGAPPGGGYGVFVVNTPQCPSVGICMAKVNTRRIAAQRAAIMGLPRGAGGRRAANKRNASTGRARVLGEHNPRPDAQTVGFGPTSMLGRKAINHALNSPGMAQGYRGKV